MNLPALIIAALLSWLVLSILLAPIVGARLAGRRMSHNEREVLAWAWLGFALGLFLLALLVIGATP